VIVSDYNKGFIKFEDLFEIGKNSKLSILDTKRTINNKIVKAFSFIKLNEKEYDNNKHIKDLSNVIITLGANGTKFKNKVYPVQKPRETIDVSGAGDTFTASFILKFNQNKNVEESIDFANKMASIVVSKKGVSVPN
jgi:bifunctional ADP-heptose synthase (sugar kinase/adenylyltransferase)